MGSIRIKKSVLGLFTVSLAILIISASAKSTSTSSAKIKSDKVSGEKPVGTNGENVFLKVARSLAVEAISDFRESARRNPKLGFNFTLPMGLPSNLTNLTNLGDLTDVTSLPVPVTIGISAVSIKSAIIAALAGVKIFLVNVLLTILAILFLVSGTAFFVCNLGIVSCSNTLGGLNTGTTGTIGSFGSSGASGSNSITSLFNSRAGLAEQYDKVTHPVYKAFEEGYKKYQ